MDLPNDINLTDAEVDTIVNALQRSRWLRYNIKSLYRLYKWLPRLASGYYDDYGIPYPEGITHSRYTEEELDAMFIIVTEDDEDVPATSTQEIKHD